MRDLSPKKIFTVATREFRSTALTRAFLFGAVIFPLLIWGVMIGVSMLNFKKPPLEGTIAIADETSGQVILPSVQAWFDVEKAKARAAEEKEKLDKAIQEKTSNVPGVTKQQIETSTKVVQQFTGIGIPVIVTVEPLAEPIDMEAQRKRAVSNEVLAVARITEEALQPRAPAFDEQGKAKPEANGGPGTYEFIQSQTLRPDHADQLRGAINNAIQDERMRRAGIDPNKVREVQRSYPMAQTKVVTASGERKANEGLTRFLPLIFMMLIYIAAITGGQYLMMGTLEEKSSRVMEVILSAVSSRELLIGKLFGQGLVGLAVLGIYSAVGIAAADRFNVVGQLPMNVLPWAVVYFLIAYALLGSMMLAVGSAVTEIREAQALYTPITMSIIIPFLLIMPIMENPGSVLARIASFFPFTTPYAMVMRLSQPSHHVPLWELIATTASGLLGVTIMIWAASKIFRVGVLMYGKPPSLLGLLKWIRYA